MACFFWGVACIQNCLNLLVPQVVWHPKTHHLFGASVGRWCLPISFSALYRKEVVMLVWGRSQVSKADACLLCHIWRVCDGETNVVDNRGWKETPSYDLKHRRIYVFMCLPLYFGHMLYILFSVMLGIDSRASCLVGQHFPPGSNPSQFTMPFKNSDFWGKTANKKNKIK